MYRVGFPGWTLAARLGVPLLVKIEVVRDVEAGVLVATSSGLAGLVVEAKDLDHLMPAVYDCVAMLLHERLKRPLKSKAVAAWDGEFCPA